jgi:putative acetyltransferase
MITIKRTDSNDHDFIKLVNALDAYLAERNGVTDVFYAPLNKIDDIKYVTVAYENDVPVACGAIKHYDKENIEVKRMYTLPAHRSKGIAAMILHELENWANELNYSNCILETGKEFDDAVGLYSSSGYSIIPNFDPYVGVKASICFRKMVR